jgi:hypothetical protein
MAEGFVLTGNNGRAIEGGMIRLFPVPRFGEGRRV